MTEKITPKKEQTLDSIRNPKAEKLAEVLYSENLPYHNFEHALRAVVVGLEIADKCIEEGLGVNKEVVYYALLFHDAGYHLDYLGEGFSNKEEYSAHLAEINLREIGIDAKIIKLVKRAILATVQGAEFYSTEEIIVRAADLAEMASDYEIFLENNKKLKAEQALLTAVPISWNDWKIQTKKVVEFYLSQDIKLTSAYKDEDGNSVFHKKAKENLEKFMKENFEGKGKI
jgi:predicted metal-dependent HD superfamily phosphohydrolase